jgi:hypothetical protein
MLFHPVFRVSVKPTQTGGVASPVTSSNVEDLGPRDSDPVLGETPLIRPEGETELAVREAFLRAGSGPVLPDVIDLGSPLLGCGVYHSAPPA